MIVHPLGEALLVRFRDDLPQGLLLSGPEGVGLLTIAAEIARSFTPELVTVIPDAKGTISIDRIRELYALGRSKGSKTAFIIDDADAMGIEAQNAFLKLLEEPVPGVRFILTSHHDDRLLSTIRSRVEAHVIKRITTQQSNGLLNALGVTDPTKRAQLLFIADGLPAALTRFTADEASFAARSQIIRDARAFLGGSREDRLLLIATYKDRSVALALIDDMIRLLRRTIEAAPKPGATDSLDVLLDVDAALHENASVRLSLTRAALLV